MLTVCCPCRPPIHAQKIGNLVSFLESRTKRAALESEDWRDISEDVLDYLEGRVVENEDYKKGAATSSPRPLLSIGITARDALPHQRRMKNFSPANAHPHSEGHCSNNHAVILLPRVAGNAVKFLPCHADIIGKIFLNGAIFFPLQHPPHIHLQTLAFRCCCPLPAGRTHVSEKQTCTGGEANKLIPPRVTRQYFKYLCKVIKAADDAANVKILQPLVLTLHERKIHEVHRHFPFPSIFPRRSHLPQISHPIPCQSP